MRTVLVNLFKINELSKEAQEHAYQTWLNTDAGEYDNGIMKDDITELGGCIGINIEKVLYSGFYSQGDGACFEGTYSYKSDWKNDLECYAPLDETMFTLGEELEKVYKKYGLVEVTVSHTGRYYHENSVDIECEYDNDDDAEDEKRFIALGEIDYLLKDFMKHTYKLLQQDYEYQTSKDYFIETSLDNDYEYRENGEQF